MGKSTASAPEPDPNIGKAALQQAQTGQDWLDFAKDAFATSQDRQADLDNITKQVTEQQLGVLQQQQQYATEDRDRYESEFVPVEDQFVQEASNYDTPEKENEAAASAKADVLSSAAATKAANQRSAESMGLNPASGRFQGIDRSTDLATTLGVAGAENSARTNVQNQGLALKADVANLGNGLPAQSAAATSLGLSAGSGAVGLNQSTNAQYIASTGIVGQGYQGAMSGYSGEANTLNQQYQNQLSAWEAQQQADAASAGGIGKAFGAIIGALPFSSDKTVKKDKKPIKQGAGLDAVNKMPVEEWTYKDGQGDGGTHVGTYAQDFQKATGKGDGKTISPIDAIGITMKAVQDLDQKVDKIADVVGLGDAAKSPPAKRRTSQSPKNARGRRTETTTAPGVIGLGAVA